MESIFLVECEIPSLRLVVELLPETSSLEEHLVHLEHLDEQRRDATTMNEAHKKRVKTQYDKFAILESFLKVTLSWSMAKIRMPWGQANLSLCGTVLSLLNEF